MKAVIFEPDHDGILFLEWQSKNGVYYHTEVNTRKLSRASFKRLVWWIISCGQWYKDYRWDYYHENCAYATEDATSKPLTSLDVARWLIWARRS